MSQFQQNRPPAQTITELDLHLMYLRDEVAKLVAAMPLMATKSDIEALARRFEGYATQDDMRAVRTDLEVLRQKVDDGSVSTTLERIALWAQRLTVIATFLAAAALLGWNLIEKFK